MTVARNGRVHDGPLCGAQKRRGDGTCGQMAGWGTDHVGVGKCKLHGGASPIRNPAAAALTEVGRYRLQNQPAIRTLMDEYAKDPDPLNVLTEVALARALLHHRLERMHEGLCPTCKRPADEEALPPLIELVTRAVGRIEKARAQRSVSVQELVNLLQQIALVVKSHVRDPDTIEAIARDVDSLIVSISATRGW